MSTYGNEKREKKFLRDGAKYVCKTCKKKYFSKSEVEACFDSHEGASSSEEESS
ncbi:MAG: hypothetical protein AB8C84_06370 [Oligoflexales bacterium]